MNGRADFLRASAACWLLAAALVLAGCAGVLGGRGAGPEAEFLHGQHLFESGRYLEAIQALEAFRTEHPGSDRVDDAIVLLGKAHAKMGENLLARDEFDRLLRDFPQSDHREEAQFEKAMAWLADSHGPALDPEPTQSALDAFRLYVRNYPEGSYRAEAEKYQRTCLDRLAAKAFLNGATYLRLHQPGAARTYFKKSLSILNDSSCAGDALVGLARASELLGEAATARDYYQQLIDFATPERLRGNPKLRALKDRASQALAQASSKG